MGQRQPGTVLAAFGAHEGHQIHPHDHSVQMVGRRPWCNGRWLCLSCATRDLPRGVWFPGPECAAPRAGRVKARG
jgi:hypothetical protein